MNQLIKSITVSLFFFSLAACGGGGGGGGSVSVSTGVLNLSVTDAAVDDAEKVLVQFTSVSVKPAEGPALDIALTGDSLTCRDFLDGASPTTTAEGTETIRCIDLLNLQGTQSAGLLAGVELDAGNYTWMRLGVQAERGEMDSIIVLTNGNWESLYVPSGSQSGLKINSSYTILAGGRSDFVIDFDLRKSVNDPKGFDDYRLKPSLRLIDMAESGNIVGTVDVSLITADGCSESSAVYVYEGEDASTGEEGSNDAPLTSALVNLANGDNQWRYTVGFLEPGTYTVVFTCQAGLDTPDVDTDLDLQFVSSDDSPATVNKDQDTEVDF